MKSKYFFAIVKSDNKDLGMLVASDTFIKAYKKLLVRFAEKDVLFLIDLDSIAEIEAQLADIQNGLISVSEDNNVIKYDILSKRNKADFDFKSLIMTIETDSFKETLKEIKLQLANRSDNHLNIIE